MFGKFIENMYIRSRRKTVLSLPILISLINIITYYALEIAETFSIEKIYVNQ